MSTPDTVVVETPGLRLEDLSVERGGRAVVAGVSLEIPPGQVTALLGANGAGKSSLVLAVGGLLRKSGGRVLVGDRELTRLRPEQVRAAGVAVVPEGRRLLPALTVADNLRVATYSLGGAQAKAGVAHALELFPELEKRWNHTARLLSGGEQQMVVLAQALVSQPRFVLVDELSLGLAPVVIQRLVPVLQSVATSGVGVLLIEQFANVALGLAETAYVLERGRIHYHGTAQRLKDEPQLLQSAYLLREVDSGGDALETVT
ncbi:MAG TPA: ATP-binding cassette domain-containing protein [Gaiella sp.]|nr:ATP-binding cassette domain-containing protein [Gaiella sp.]